MMLLWMLLLGGCLGFAPHARLPVTAEDNTARLSQHPQFEAAAQVAPDFVKDCFSTITRLERENVSGR